ncbi:helix-turn-helix transcriptional regulator [Yersinia sp. Marseille-Q3913]|uniref:helix-turn-helix transcriptional regulator n=1 Tax=Yersinia sp. Marseille-Q3913 TaxID=2830769 RepID=UPI001BB06B58|nr:helix-turn-helix transcriptional regulator [Yersinia sp. Marseille-Q3913]MBS0057010.1 helix-turn-helix transcriptional regulator [Yersinia sp. Marseille-Q3913]
MDRTLLASLKMLIPFWKNSSEAWGVKDNQSIFIYANDRFGKLLGLPNKFNVEGRLDGELPAPTAAFQTEFQAHDRQAILSQERATTIEIHAFEQRTYFQPYFCDKYPLIDENGVAQGLIFHARPVQNIILTHLNKIKIPTSLTFTPPSENFSKREWEVLFYLLHAYSSPEIAKRLFLSARTVCNITQSIYKKAGVTSKQQIIEYCYENKINNYVPQSFFESSGSFPLL